VGLEHDLDGHTEILTHGGENARSGIVLRYNQSPRERGEFARRWKVVQIFGRIAAMTDTVVPTSEVRAGLGKITRRFDAGDSEPVFFGSHRRAQAVLVPIATWEKLLAHAEDELDLDLARRRLADRRPWLDEDELDAALTRATEDASRQHPA